MSLLEWLTRFWYRKFADRSQAFTKILRFAKVLQQIHVRAHTKSHWQKTETEKSRDPNGLTEVELTDRKTVQLFSRGWINHRLQNEVDRKRENSYRVPYKSGSGSDDDHNYNIGSAVSLILVLTSVQDSDIDLSISDLTSAEILKTAARLRRF